MSPSMLRNRRLSLGTGLLLLAACASSTPAVAPSGKALLPDAGVAVAGTPDAPFRQNLPKPGPPVTFQPPVPTVFKLKNGLPVWVIEKHDIPLVTVEMVVAAGEDTDPARRPGTASFVADMLDEGTRTRDAASIATAFEDQAAVFRTQADGDSMAAAVSFPAGALTPVLEVFADCLLHPMFRSKDVERVRALRLGDLAQLEADPAQVGKTLLGRTVFGEDHPWAFPSLGTVSSLKAIRPSELTAWHGAWVKPNNAVLIVVGDVKAPELLAQLQSRFGSWKPAKLPKRRSVAPRPHKGPRVITVVDRPGAAQSSVWVGELGIGASSADLYPAQLAVTVLGGGYKSRINGNLRSAKGYSYGAFSFFEVQREPGVFATYAPVVADKTPEALTEILGELRRLREGGIDDLELAEAKAGLIQSLPAEFETTTATALTFGRVWALGRPPDFFVEYTRKIEAVTRDQVAAAAAQRFRPEAVAIVVVGPLADLKPRLEALELGPLDVRNASGEAAKAARAVRSTQH